MEKIHKLHKMVHWKNKTGYSKKKKKKSKEIKRKKTGGKEKKGEENKRQKRQKFPKKCVLCFLQQENVAIALLQTRHF